MRNAIPLVLQSDLSTSERLVTVIAAGDSGAYENGATHTLAAAVEDRGSNIRVEGVLRNLTTQRNQPFIVAQAPSGALISALNNVALQIDPKAAKFSTGNEGALRAFAAALQERDQQARIDLLKKAITTDPAFGFAYAALIGTPQSPQDLQATIQAAEQHRSSFTPLDQARVQAAIARVTRRPLQEQASADAALLSMTPNDLGALTKLGSDRFLLGDVKGGEEAFRRALLLSPGNFAMMQQFAEGLFQNRQFAAAERMLDDLARSNPGLLPNLAMCILLEGDTHRANDVMNRFLLTRASNPSISTAVRASWTALSGDLKSAISLLQFTPMPDTNLRSLVVAEISIWQLMSGDPAAAKKTVLSTQESRPDAFLAAAVLFARADEPADKWRAEVLSSPFDENSKQTLLGYGFFLHGRYADSVPVWRGILNRSGDTDLHARVMLASSLRHNSQQDEARKIRVQPFFPDLGDPYAAIPFRELTGMLR